MALCNCCFRCRCPIAAIILSVIAGVVAAFLHITGVFTATAVSVVVALGVAVLYLGILLLGRARDAEVSGCVCAAGNALLIGIVGSVLLSLILLAAGIVATSIFSAIGVGILVFFFVLMIAAAACLIRSDAGCGSR